MRQSTKAVLLVIYHSQCHKYIWAHLSQELKHIAHACPWAPMSKFESHPRAVDLLKQMLVTRFIHPLFNRVVVARKQGRYDRMSPPQNNEPRAGWESWRPYHEKLRDSCMREGRRRRAASFYEVTGRPRSRGIWMRRSGQSRVKIFVFLPNHWSSTSTHFPDPNDIPKPAPQTIFHIFCRARIQVNATYKKTGPSVHWALTDVACSLAISVMA